MLPARLSAALDYARWCRWPTHRANKPGNFASYRDRFGTQLSHDGYVALRDMGGLGTIGNLYLPHVTRHVSRLRTMLDVEMKLIRKAVR